MVVITVTAHCCGAVRHCFFLGNAVVFMGIVLPHGLASCHDAMLDLPRCQTDWIYKQRRFWDFFNLLYIFIMKKLFLWKNIFFSFTKQFCPTLWSKASFFRWAGVFEVARGRPENLKKKNPQTWLLEGCCQGSTNSRVSSIIIILKFFLILILLIKNHHWGISIKKKKISLKFYTISFVVFLHKKFHVSIGRGFYPFSVILIRITAVEGILDDALTGI